MSRQAVLIAGGSATRLRPLSHGYPKQLMPVGDRPLLAHIVDWLSRHGVEDCVILTSPESLRSVKGATESERRMRLTYVVQEQPTGVGDAIRIAGRALPPGPFLAILGDNYFTSDLSTELAEFEANAVDCGLFLLPVHDPQRFGVAEVHGARVTRLTEKPSRPDSNLAVIGIYYLGQAFLKIAATVGSSQRGEVEITDCIQALIDHEGNVTWRPFRGEWIDAGAPKDLLRANATALVQLTDARLGSLEAVRTVGSPIHVQVGACVRDTDLIAPCFVAAGAHITGGSIGPNVSVNAGAKLRNVVARNSVIFENADIDDATLEESLIGPRAKMSLDRNHLVKAVLSADACVTMESMDD